MYFEHNYMHIDAIMLQPDNNQIEIVREKNLSSDNTIKLTATVEVQSYYPAFVTDQEIRPFRTRWFNNIISLRTGSPRPGNPNAGLDNLNKND